ncbi:hypothetical protein FRC15_004250 [Serendipita sp. 397]|nr:hypothetical protein FRC15_004250 [Serendipita sp. 397]
MGGLNGFDNVEKWSLVSSRAVIMTAISCSALVILASILLYRRSITTRAKITRIFVHPIKSCRGTSVLSCEYTPTGLRNDRTFVIIDKETHRTVTARDIPKMVLVHPHIDDGGILRIQFPEDSGMSPLLVPLEPSPEVLADWKRIEDVQIWSHTTDGYICQSVDKNGIDPSTALSKYLGKDVFLMFKGPTTRHVGPPAAFPHFQSAAVFQDGYALLIASEESLVDVQQKVNLSANGVEGWSINGVAGVWEGEIVMERFRPNIVIEGAGKPYAEEEWEEVVCCGKSEAGNKNASSEYGRMILVSRCTRCQLPNIEPTTGVQHKHVPYKVLAKYRRVDPLNPYTPCFGVNAVPKESGIYRVGDTITVAKYAKAGKLPTKPGSK